ncbi:MAG: DNA polymerase III subunit gamma/tau [Actinomycetota bacterium]|nr:DNA polymerase III subunit gamma/tau [Actinomycetota bacterium]
MSYISFYRKWRPRNFDEIIGQEYNIKTIKNAISNNRLSHCYIFCGPRGTGKTSTARILAKALNCVKGITPDPCNKCSNCISISNGSSVDVVEIDAASNRGIDEIRELREKVKYLPNVLRKKVYIIDEVHMLTPEAFNALLKILEEPPEHVIFIMATTEPNRVIPTILSRCQRFDFYPIPADKIKIRIRNIAENENITISESAINLISKYADGSLRDADSILEQLAAFGGNKIEVRDVISLLGITDLDLLFNFTDILIKKNLTEAFLIVNKIIESNQNLKIFISEFLSHLYDLYVIKNYSNPFEILNISEDYKEKYLSQAKELQKEEMEFYMELFTDLLNQARWSEQLKVFFKSTVIKAINYNVIDKKDREREIAALEAQIQSLKKEINKIKSIKNNFQDIYVPKNEADKCDMGSEDKDFDLINTAGLDKVVNEVEVLSVHKSGKESIGKVSKRSKGTDKETDRKTDTKGDDAVHKEDNEESSMIKLINDNMEKIIQSLRKEKASVYGMFVEAEPDRIENNVLYFHLDENKEWHRDNLNKNSNIVLISNIIKKVTGKNFRVEFETKKKGSVTRDEQDSIRSNSASENQSSIKSDKASNNLTDIKNGKEITRDIDISAGSGAEIGATSSNGRENKEKQSINKKSIDRDTNSKSESSEDIDIFSYFEKKFNIKE